MIVVRFKPRDFVIPFEYLVGLAAEHYGRMMHEEPIGAPDQPWNPSSDDAADAVWEFGFEDCEAGRARDLAEAFAISLKSFLRQPDKGPPSIGSG